VPVPANFEAACRVVKLYAASGRVKQLVADFRANEKLHLPFAFNGDPALPSCLQRDHAHLLQRSFPLLASCLSDLAEVNTECARLVLKSVSVETIARRLSNLNPIQSKQALARFENVDRSMAGALRRARSGHAAWQPKRPPNHDRRPA
jgi:hypothetical protein